MAAGNAKKEVIGELQGQITALEMKNKELEEEIQRKSEETDQGQIGNGRFSVFYQEESQLALPPQEDCNITEFPQFEDYPDMRETEVEGGDLEPIKPPFLSKAKKLVVANEATYLESRLYKSGSLYENSEVELYAKPVTIETACSLSIVFKNRSENALTDFTIVRTPDLELGLRFPEDSTIVEMAVLKPGEQGLGTVRCTCTNIFLNSPIVILSYYHQKEYKEIAIKLPISVATFTSALSAPPELFLFKYTALNGFQTASAFPRFKSMINSKEILAGFISYQGTFQVFQDDTAGVGGAGICLGKEVLFMLKKSAEDGNVLIHCRSLDTTLREAVSAFLIGLLGETYE